MCVCRFVCETETTDTVKSGTITVVVDNMYTAESDSPFSFVVSLCGEVNPRLLLSRWMPLPPGHQGSIHFPIHNLSTFFLLYSSV